MDERTTPTETIFYDGDCGVCHWAVSFVAKRDPAKVDAGGEAFRFAPLHGETFKEIVPENRRTTLPDSLVVATTDGRLLLRSVGAIHILRRLKWPWPWLGALVWLVPRPLRDFGYDRFATIRHRMAKRPDGACPLMPPELARRFAP